MISGHQALESIEQALNQVRGQIVVAESEIGDASVSRVTQQQAQADDYLQLARVSISRLSDPELIQHLDQAGQQAAVLLEKRSEAVARLQHEIEEADQVREQQEVERKYQSGQVDAAVDAVDKAEATIQDELDAQPEYVAQRRLAEQAERQAAHGAEKAERSAQEKLHKGASYEQDPLFQYLWNRKYGLPEYDASAFIRWLDGKVARLINFADARANYSMLNEIPLRLREHAEHLAVLADTEYRKLKELDKTARSATAISELEEQVIHEQSLLDQIDERIRQGEQVSQELLSKKALFATGEDDFTQRVIQLLATEFQRDDLTELSHDAFNTPYPEDDMIVSRMLRRKDEQRQVESSIAGLKGVLEQHRKRLMELETLRADFKNKRFDRVGSVFSGSSMVSVLLGQFLSGLLNKDLLWEVLQQQQRYRPRRSKPDFGSGGFGRGTVWKGGMGDLGDIIGDLGRGGFGNSRGRSGKSGGGFRSGGGF